MYDHLAVVNTVTGETVPLNDWLRDHRRRQLHLILAQLGQGETGVGTDETARALFAPRGKPS